VTRGKPPQVTRREVVEILSAVPLTLLLGCSAETSQRVARAARDTVAARAAGARFEPRFFTPPEYETVRVLADIIIPRDDRSGSATDAGVPEFMDFMMADQDTSAEARTAMRGGLAWLDAECRRRFGRPFVDGVKGERTALLDQIAWPAKAKPEMSQGVAFFNAFRDLTASGFWSSEMGVKDLRYQGNSVVPEWTGCPETVLRKIGVRYDDK
jgi:gluconate 2-dehydrogenase subunit 3-like protein